MAIRNIRVKGDPILKLKSRHVERFDGRLCTLLDDMRETMYRADGCGLAAVQFLSVWSLSMSATAP